METIEIEGFFSLTNEVATYLKYLALKETSGDLIHKIRTTLEAEGLVEGSEPRLTDKGRALLEILWKG